MDILTDIMGMKVSYNAWNKKKSLSLFITGNYDFKSAEIDGHKCIVIIPKEDLPTLPALKKQIKKIQDIENIPVVIKMEGISNFRRKSMIENKIPFITQKQVYLPFMGTLLKDTNDKKIESIDKFMFSTQQLALLYLYSDEEEMYITEARKKLPFSAMSMTRAVRQLEATGFFYIKKDGVNKIIESKYDKEELYQKIKKYMVSPIKNKGYIEKNIVTEGMVLSGVSALSERTMLNDDIVKTYAIYIHKFDKDLIIDELVDPDTQVQIELWGYEPELFATLGTADPISIALSFFDTNDERIEEAVEEMIEEIWRK